MKAKKRKSYTAVEVSVEVLLAAPYFRSDLGLGACGWKIMDRPSSLPPIVHYSDNEGEVLVNGVTRVLGRLLAGRMVSVVLPGEKFAGLAFPQDPNLIRYCYPTSDMPEMAVLRSQAQKAVKMWVRREDGSTEPRCFPEHIAPCPPPGFGVVEWSNRALTLCLRAGLSCHEAHIEIQKRLTCSLDEEFQIVEEQNACNGRN